MRLALACSWYLKRYLPISKRHVPNNSPAPFLPISHSHVPSFSGHVWWFTPCWNSQILPLVLWFWLPHKSAEPKLDEQLSLACQNILRLVKKISSVNRFSPYGALWKLSAICKRLPLTLNDGQTAVSEALKTIIWFTQGAGFCSGFLPFFLSGFLLN